MWKNERKETQESGKIFTLTIILTKILLIAIGIAVVWLVQTILMQGNPFGGFNLM